MLGYIDHIVTLPFDKNNMFFLNTKMRELCENEKVEIHPSNFSSFFGGQKKLFRCFSEKMPRKQKFDKKFVGSSNIFSEVKGNIHF